MNRRQFLATGSVTIASLALASTAAIELAGTGAEKLATSALCRATFSQCIDAIFQLHHTSLGSIELKLSSLIDRMTTESNEQFTLIFHAPKNTELAGGTFVMAHSATGYFPLYLESAGHDDRGSLFRADFNLTKS